MQKPTYAFDVEGHTVVKGGLAKCADCGAELIAPYDGNPYWCTECSQKEDERRGRR
jgi:hypothetical protein